MSVYIERDLSDNRLYSHALQNDVSVNDGLHIRRWSHKIIILCCYNTYHCVTIAYSIQYGGAWGSVVVKAQRY
jgi:hypothetical protein